MPAISLKLVSKINSEHLISTPLQPADLLFVFGTRHGTNLFIDKVTELWQGGYFKYVIVSGGKTPGGETSEATEMHDLLVSAGVPKERILCEHAAMNTGENVIFSLPIIEREIGLEAIQSVIALGKLCCSRRYLMTLERHWPNVEKMLVAINWFGVPREEWHLHAQSRQRVLSEYNKIQPYLDKGFIAEWPRPNPT